MSGLCRWRPGCDSSLTTRQNERYQQLSFRFFTWVTELQLLVEYKWRKRQTNSSGVRRCCGAAFCLSRGNETFCCRQKAQLNGVIQNRVSAELCEDTISRTEIWTYHRFTVNVSNTSTGVPRQSHCERQGSILFWEPDSVRELNTLLDSCGWS